LYLFEIRRQAVEFPGGCFGLFGSMLPVQKLGLPIRPARDESLQVALTVKEGFVHSNPNPRSGFDQYLQEGAGPAPFGRTKCFRIEAARRIFGVQAFQDIDIQLVNRPRGCHE
jgi:hypothetical protein